MTVNGVDITVNGITDISEEEVLGYIDYIQGKTKENIASMTISGTDENNVALDYQLRPVKFERIRRITGYLVGTTDRWNNAKRAEEQDRVKHGLN